MNDLSKLLVSAALGSLAGVAVKFFEKTRVESDFKLYPEAYAYSKVSDRIKFSSPRNVALDGSAFVLEELDLIILQTDRPKFLYELYQKLEAKNRGMELSILVRLMSKDDLSSVVERFLSEGEVCSSLIISYALKEIGQDPDRFDPKSFLASCGKDAEMSERLLYIYLPMLEEEISTHKLSFEPLQNSDLLSQLNLNNSLSFIQEDPVKVLEFCFSKDRPIEADEIVDRLIRLSPSVVAEKLESLPDEVQNSVRENLINHLVEFEPSVLFNEVAQGHIRNLSQQQTIDMFENWACNDLLAASEATQNLPPGSIHGDWALAGLINVISEYDQESASQWLTSIVDDSLRQSLSDEILAK